MCREVAVVGETVTAALKGSVRPTESAVVVVLVMLLLVIVGLERRMFHENFNR